MLSITFFSLRFAECFVCCNVNKYGLDKYESLVFVPHYQMGIFDLPKLPTN